MLNIFKFERLMIAVRASQTALIHLEELIAWCKQRILSGSDLMQKQSIQFKISELYCEIIGAISQTYLCIELIESKKNCEKEILIAKYIATSILEKLCDFSMQMYAAEGYKNDSHCAKLFCDSTALSLAGGSNEILLDSLVKIFLQEQ
jgi:alkylation response protein AidB-like acyl-CoA dehydrogenase